MVRRAAALLLLVAACGSLKDAKEPDTTAPANDAGTASERDATTTDDDDDDVVVVPKDAGSDAAVECDGPCETEDLVTGLGAASPVTVAGDNIYFVDGGGAIFQCPKTGCAGKPIRLGLAFPTAITVVGNDVIWSDYQRAGVFSCAIGGCDEKPKEIAASELGVRGVWGDGQYVFWAATGVPTGSTVTIRRCLPGACTPAAVTGSLGTLTTVTVSADGTLLYLSGGSVHSCPRDDCSSSIALTQGAAKSIALANGRAFWVVQAEIGSIFSCSVSGCGAGAKSIGNSIAPYALAADASKVYWRDKTTSAIHRCPVDGCGGPPESFVKDEVGADNAGLALDDDYVYWSTKTAVRRRHK